MHHMSKVKFSSETLAIVHIFSFAPKNEKSSPFLHTSSMKQHILLLCDKHEAKLLSCSCCLTYRADIINLFPQSPTMGEKLLRGITLPIVVTRVGSGCGLMMPLLLLSPPAMCCMIKLMCYSTNKYRQLQF